MQEGLAASAPGPQFNIDLFILGRYLDACYRVMGLEQPIDVSIAWGEVNMLVASGKVASYKDWCRMTGIIYMEQIEAQEDEDPRNGQRGYERSMELVRMGEANFISKEQATANKAEAEQKAG